MSNLQLRSEVFKPIVGYNYEVSNYGNIKSLQTYLKSKINAILKPKVHPDGYLYINLYKDKRCYTFKIHRLVAEVFVPNPNNYPVVNHLDFNRANNKAENLQWTTQPENIKYSIAAGKKMGGCYVPRNPIAVYRNNLLIATYISLREASRQMNLDSSAISKTLKGKISNHKGFTFQILTS